MRSVARSFQVLEVAFNDGSYILWAALFVGAGLTAFYSFRLIMLVLFGDKVQRNQPLLLEELKELVHRSQMV